MDWVTYLKKGRRNYAVFHVLTHWGRVTHICVSNLTTIGSVNGLSPGRRQAITWTNAGILLIRPLGTNFSEIVIEISTFSFEKMRLKISSAKWRPFSLGLNVLTHRIPITHTYTCFGELVQHLSRYWRGPATHAYWFSIVLGNGLIPVRCQAITWTNTNILLIRNWWTNCS